MQPGPIPNLMLHSSLVVLNPPPDAERPEPFGYRLKEGNFFRPEESDLLLEQFVGWHDWAVYLNLELGMLYRLSHACLDGRDPVTFDEGTKVIRLPDCNPFPDVRRSFPDSLVDAIPQFILMVWELGFNNWHPMHHSHSISRLLLKLRERRPARIGRTQYRSAVDAVFRSAFSLASLLANWSQLEADLADLRRRHGSYQAANPWCWLRWYYDKQQTWDILQMLGEEVARWREHRIITPERQRCERWYRATWARWVELLPTGPGFDWFVRHSDPIDVPRLSGSILSGLEGYDEGGLAQELADELDYVAEWWNRAVGHGTVAIHPDGSASLQEEADEVEDLDLRDPDFEAPEVDVPPDQASVGQVPTPPKGLTKKAMALALLADHPDWTNERIAKAVGCHPKYLSQLPQFKAAKRAIRASGRGQMPHGSKTVEGDIEAWERTDHDD